MQYMFWYILTILVQFQNKETANVRFFIKVMTKMKLQQQFHLTPPALAQCHQGRCHLHWGGQLQQEGWMCVRMEQIN